MSKNAPIELLDDDDDDDDDDEKESDQSLDYGLSQEQVKKLDLFMEFTGCVGRPMALMKLRRVSFDVERALAQQFDGAPVEMCDIASSQERNGGVIDAKRRVTTIKSNSELESESSTSLLSSAPQEQRPKLSSLLLSAEWHRCMESCAVGTTFVDPDFPPMQSSLDGRKQTDASITNNSKQDIVITCVCGLPAAAKSVQSDGPNYGRFYLCCGKARQQRSSNRIGWKEQQCKFFQWDDKNGSKGAGYATRYSLMRWQYFGPPQCVLFHKRFSPDAVRQGAIGNCWFLSALAVAAEKEYIIQQLLLPHQRKLNDKGCYQINLCLDGKWTAIIVDSNLPVVYGKRIVDPLRSGGTAQQTTLATTSATNSNTQTSHPAFSAVLHGQLWPALIEKAYAKAHGSYAHLSGGFIHEAFGDLTGAPTETLVFDGGKCWDLDELWTRLLSFHQAGFLMGVATSQGGEGLVGGHAYSVLDVIEAHDALVGKQQTLKDFCVTGSPAKKQRTNVRLVRIRNPWGTKEWKGEWSVNSDKWTRALRKRLGEQNSYAKGDGTFFMSFTDMITRFHHMDVAKCQEGWNHSSIDGVFVSSDPLFSSKHCYKISVGVRGLGSLSVVQPKKRANTQSNYWYADPSFVVLKKKKKKQGGSTWEGEQAKLVGFLRSSSVEVFLDPAYEYVCVPFSCRPRREAPFRLCAYGPYPIKLEKVEYSRLISSAILQQIHRHLLTDERRLQYVVANQASLVCTHGQRCLYFVAVNASRDFFLSMYLSVRIPKGVIIAYGSEKDTLDLRPQSQKVLLVVASDGTLSRATSIEFSYATDTTRPGKSIPTNAANNGKNTRLSATVEITMAGELLANTQASGLIRSKGGDTIETFQWLNQIGCSL